MKISSQKYLDQEIVDKKIEKKDFVVTLATISNDTDIYQVVIDGHHSLEAAKQAGIDPFFKEADYNYQEEVECIGFDNWLEQHYIDSDWYDINTGRNVW